jgi:hypothetical protein
MRELVALSLLVLLVLFEFAWAALAVALHLIFDRIRSRPSQRLGNEAQLVARAKSVRVLTYNVFARPPFVKNNKNDWKNERLREILRHLQDYDVVALQELFSFGTRRKEWFIRESERLGFKFHCTCTSFLCDILRFFVFSFFHVFAKAKQHRSFRRNGSMVVC